MYANFVRLSLKSVQPFFFFLEIKRGVGKAGIKKIQSLHHACDTWVQRQRDCYRDFEP